MLLVCALAERFQSRTELSALRKQLQEATKTSEQTSEVRVLDGVCVETSLYGTAL